MPGSSTTIYQEGLIIPPIRLFRRGELQEDVQRLVLANVRTPSERRGDLNAQLAALRVGAKRIEDLTHRFGRALLEQGFAATLNYSERRMHRRLRELPPGVYEAEDRLDDDGSTPEPVVIKVRVEVSSERLTLDFEGSSPQRQGNVSAIAPMTQSACFFAVKLLMDPTLPANAGVLRRLDIRIPDGQTEGASRLTG